MAKTAPLKIKLVKWSTSSKSKGVREFLTRPSIPVAAEKVASRVLKDIRKNGDNAVARYAKKFDGAVLRPHQFKVKPGEFRAARKSVDKDFEQAAAEAHQRVTRFARAGLRKNWEIKTPKGGTLGERFLPLDRVGVYIPGGTAPLASTAIMTAALAQVAGVKEIVACSPAGKDGKINPYILRALEISGATEVYRIGGIQAVGAMAYGTRTIRPVQKIVGPGNAYVTAAKKLVYGTVAIDMLAGPSEVAVLADDSVPASYIAADLLSQAEHGTGLERALLVTDSLELARAVRRELHKQLQSLSRSVTTRQVLEQGTLLAVVPDLEQGAELINQFAPEHFELLVRQPKKWLPRIRCAAAIFIGPWTPECAGDFAAGPSHVLPTGGTAAMFAGLTVDDFQRRSSVLNLKQADLKQVLPVIEAFSRVEGLDAHARSARIRFTP